MPDSPRRLFAMGFLTNLLNPKAALLYLSLLPQFIEPGRGNVLEQTLLLGAVQISVSLIVNACIICSAGTVAQFLQGRLAWASAQRYLMGGVLGALGARIGALLAALIR